MIRRFLILPIWCLCLVHDSSARASDLWHVEGTPKVVAQDLQFSNGSTTLSGTLYLPEQGNHLPAVVALHGASDATRDSALFRHLREGLPAMGFAVLIYDRRGSGKSSGSLRNIDYETLADDAIAGQRALAKVARIDPDKIGFWGLSQGGWLAILAAGRSQNAAFAIAVSAPLVTPEQQMEFATTNLLTIRGYSQQDVEEMLAARRAWTGYLRGTNSRTATLDALRKVETKPWFELAFMPKSSALTSDPEHNSYRREMDDDLIAALRKVRFPLLLIYGGADPWIPVHQSLEEVRKFIPQQPNIRYVVIPGASHEMMFNPHETMEFNTGALNRLAPEAPAYFMTMASWLVQQVCK